MRIGFDVSPLHHPHSRGIERLVRELTGAIERRGRIEVVRLAPEPGEDLRRWRWSVLPRRVRELGLDGVHSHLSAFPLRGPGRRVHTIHELPWRHGVRENAGPRHRLWAALGPLRADRVICSSEFVASDVRARLLPGSGKVRVVPWGVSEAFADEPAPGEVDEVLLGRYRIGQDRFALCLGAVREKKNLAAVLHGVAEHVRRGGTPLQVVVTGPETAQLRRDLGLVSKLGLARWVSTPGEVEEAHLPGLLRLATLVPFLSPSEGFGLPVLEAMASGTPVVVPRGSAQSELAGAVGIEVDPADPGSVADGLSKAIEERDALRGELWSRAREFTWDRSAEGIEAVWGELA